MISLSPRVYSRSHYQNTRPVRKEMWWRRVCRIDGQECLLYLSHIANEMIITSLSLFLPLSAASLNWDQALNLLETYSRGSWRSHTGVSPVLPSLRPLQIGWELSSFLGWGVPNNHCPWCSCQQFHTPPNYFCINHQNLSLGLRCRLSCSSLHLIT